MSLDANYGIARPVEWTCESTLGWRCLRLMLRVSWELKEIDGTRTSTQTARTDPRVRKDSKLDFWRLDKLCKPIKELRELVEHPNAHARVHFMPRLQQYVQHAAI